ncbi:MAG: LPS assembly protein LptD, partial [Tepidisphaeraceae bacterium]
QIPLMVRAESIRQLSVGEYRTEKVELSTSQFATPSYSIKADRAYVRQEETGDPRYGTRTSYTARDATIDLFGLPVFYTPVVSGALTDRGSALRSLYFEDSNRFGPSVRSEWGLFESLGVLPPEDLDITYKLEYLGDRGPAGGIGATYQGGYITETTRQAWDFQGRMDSYIIDDHGTDDLGKDRLKVEPPDQIRGKILWEHQHFFPGDWQAQVRMGYLSDPTFLEEYFEREFDQSQQYEAAAYLKRQRDTEALTLLITFQPNGFPTVSNQLQEQAAVERYPEIGYHRIGDSIGDSLTLFSDNTFAALQFRTSDATLAEEGFAPGQSPGIPSYAQTGTTESTTFRADFREEIDWPLALGRFKVVPYVVGRYTPYSDSPDGGSENRFLVAAGLRVATAFWRVDDTAESNLFDIHRVRHVIEPEMNLFTSYSTVDRDDLFIYDENVDAINDISAAQFAIRQRWQTKRGGAGNFRSVDFFTLNVELNLFANQPSESDLNPAGFRGLFFFSDPEASIPRNSLNADALWRVSDTTAILSDVQYNLDQFELATTSIGLAVQRDPRVSYFIGARYIGQINSTLGNFAVDYELSPKYAILFAQSFNFSEEQNQDTRVTVIRKFDHFALTFTYFYDAVEDDSGFRFGLIPEGMGSGYNTGQLQSLFVQ